MERVDDRVRASKTLRYDLPEPSVVFRIAWYVAASPPGVLLSEHSEAESQVFDGRATFTATTSGVNLRLRVAVDGAKKSIEVTAFGADQAVITRYVNDLASMLESSLRKYRSLPDKEKNKLRRALVAKTCWDRVVHDVFRKSPLSEIYFDLSHGREMIVQATEGEDVHPVALTTAAWLSKIEKLPRDRVLPPEIATELAKKTIEWKKETHAVISRYL